MAMLHRRGQEDKSCPVSFCSWKDQLCIRIACGPGNTFAEQLYLEPFEVQAMQDYLESKREVSA